MSLVLRPYLDKYPQIDPSSYIDDTAVIIGDVHLAADVSVWPCAVLRGDVNSIHIGARTNIQDHCMLHVSHKTAEQPQGSPLVIGEDVTIGHHVSLHGCRIGNQVLVGINSVVLDDVVIEDHVMIGAGSLVPPRKHLASGYLYLGSPVKAVRLLTEEELNFLPYSAQHYVSIVCDYKLTQQTGVST